MRFRVSDLRIGTRLRLSYAALLLLTVLLASVSMARLQHLSKALREAVQQQHEAQTRVQRVNSDAEVSARKLLVLIGAPRNDRVAAYREIDAANRRLDEAVTNLKMASIAEGVYAVFPQVEAKLKAFREDYTEVVDLIEADDVVAARKLLGGRTEASLTALIEALAVYSRAEQAQIDRNASELEELVRRDWQNILGICVAALVLGLFLSTLVSRGILAPLALTQEGAERIAAGNYEHRVADCAKDEVGALGRSLNKLAQAVAEREAARVDAAETEALTRLPIRRRFLRDGEDFLRQRAKRHEWAMLVCVDVNRLKSINSVLGFEAGDTLLHALARRLRDVCGPHALFGRLSGGALVVLMPTDSDAKIHLELARLHDGLEHRIEWCGHAMDVAVTMGAAVFPTDIDGAQAQGSDVELLLRRAEAAMYEAKQSKVSSLQFDRHWEQARESHLSLLSSLKEAVEHDHLRQFLQPKVDIATGQVVGAEALVRWQHPARGFISPAEFIPFAEQTGRIRELTRWMLRRAIHNLAHMPALEDSGRYLAVNISTLDLADTNLPAWLAAELSSAAVAPTRLQLEVTESGLLSSGDGPVEVLSALRNVGVSLALDDFGTGQSSLAYLQRLPVQELKIDRSFVSSVELDIRRQSLLKAIVELGHGLGMKVTAEGVETAAELDVLESAGVDTLQGFLISKPLTESDFEQTIRAIRGPVTHRSTRAALRTSSGSSVNRPAFRGGPLV